MKLSKDEKVVLYTMLKQSKIIQFGVQSMSDNKSIIQRDELHSKIWKIADDLRGSVDGWDFKQYVLGMLFYRYISEHLANYINKNEWDSGNKEFNYADLKDEDVEDVKADIITEQGFFISQRTF